MEFLLDWDGKHDDENGRLVLQKLIEMVGT